MPVAASFTCAALATGPTRPIVRIEAIQLAADDPRAQPIRDDLVGRAAATDVNDPHGVVSFTLQWRWQSTGGSVVARALHVEPAPRGGLTHEVVALRGYVDAILADSPGDPVIPVGHCSTDDRPEEVANAELRRAFDEAATGRFVRLRLRVHGGLPRVAYGTHRPPPIVAVGLPDTPIAIEAFYAGLCCARAGDDYDAPLIPDDPLGVQIVEAGLADVLAPWLRRMAEDPAVDPFNRLRMARILASVLGHGRGEPRLSIRSTWTRDSALVLQQIETLDLCQAARWWFGFR